MMEEQHKLMWAILLLKDSNIGDIITIHSSSTRNIGMMMGVLAPTSKVYEYKVIVDVNELQLKLYMMRL